MSPRDVEKIVQPAAFAATLRRIADAVEQGESLRIQVLNERLTIPGNAELSIEHEADGNEHELELQLKWKA
jgi:amphi-Trp domain-containing protein